MSSKYVFAILLLLLFALAACSTAGSATPTAAPTTEATQAPALATEAPTAAALPTATIAASGPSGAPASQTGITMVDAIAAAVLSNDPAQVRPLIQFQTIPCTTADGLGGPPKCAEGQAEGTEVTGFPVIGGEGGFVGETTIDGTLNSLKTSGLFGVYVVPTDPPAEPYYPKGRYALVFNPAEEGLPPITIRATDEGIVRIDYNFGQTAAEAFDNNRGNGQILIAPVE